MEDSLGILFFWGIYVEDTVVPATMASIIALFNLVPYFYLFIIFVALFTGSKNLGRKSGLFVFAIFLLCQIFHSYQVYRKLGFLESLGVLGLTRTVYFCLIFKIVMKTK